VTHYKGVELSFLGSISGLDGPNIFSFFSFQKERGQQNHPNCLTNPYEKTHTKISDSVCNGQTIEMKETGTEHRNNGDKIILQNKSPKHNTGDHKTGIMTPG